MLKKDFTLHKKLIGMYAEKLKAIEYYIPSCNKFAITHKGEWCNRRIRYFHVIWNHNREPYDRDAFLKKFNTQSVELKKIVDERIRISKREVNMYETYFNLTYQLDGVIKSKKAEEKDKEGYRVSEVKRKDSVINKALQECAFCVIMSSIEMTPEEAIEAYRKRDTIEKVFRTLKSRLDMDSIRVHSNESIRSKMLIWFVAAVLYLNFFSKTENLRKNAKYDVPTMLGCDS